MKRQTIISLTAAASLGLGSLTGIAPVEAGMFDFMSPGKWFDNDNDRYYGGRYGRYGYGPYGGGYGPYGWGGGPYGWGGGPYGWGGPYGGWGGYPGYPGYGQGSTIVVTPQGGGDKQPPPKLPE